jgi:hypothetical protein
MTVNSATKPLKTKRQRGVILTPKGLQRFQAAIQELEASQVNGYRLTLDKLSEHINVSTKTLSRLLSLNLGVDQKTLKLCFKALNLEIYASDYTLLNKQTEVNQQAEAEVVSSLTFTSSENETGFPYSDAAELFGQKQPLLSSLNLSYPDGPLGLDSPFYIERSAIEALAYQEITQPGCIIRIRSPKGMGKSSLVLRLLAFAKLQKYRVAALDCRQLDSSCLIDFNKFLRCFCRSVAQALGIEPQLDDYWDEEVRGKLSCSFYFKTYLLKQIDHPVVLVLNDVDRLFEYPQVAGQFFPLLRSWYEEARQSAILQKLRLVIVYSTEEYSVLDINRSPFNVGLPLRLPELTHSQVHDLAKRYGLDWSMADVNELMILLGGHPLLTQIAFYHICCTGISLEQLLQQAIARGGIFQAHLWQLWVTLQKNSDLVDALESVVKAEHSISLNPIQAYKLESKGLICYEGTQVKLRCELYRAYFQQQLQLSERMIVAV